MFVCLILSVDIIACSKSRLSGDHDEMASDRSWPPRAYRAAAGIEGVHSDPHPAYREWRRSIKTPCMTSTSTFLFHQKINQINKFITTLQGAHFHPIMSEITTMQGVLGTFISATLASAALIFMFNAK